MTPARRRGPAAPPGRRCAAVLLAAATAWGAAVSVRTGTAGEPLGLRPPGSVATQLVAGLGSGLSAPWPMVVVVLADAFRRRPVRHPGRAATAVGALVTAGVLVEPVTWGRRARSPAVASTVAANLLAAGLLLRAGAARPLTSGGC